MGLGHLLRKFFSSRSLPTRLRSSLISTAKKRIIPTSTSIDILRKDGAFKNTINVAKQNVAAFLDPRDDGQIYGGASGKVPMNDWAIWVERTWKCNCGHTFRTTGIWVPSEPGMCEAPGCPNPRFYMLECNKHFLIQQKGNKALVTPPKK